MAKKTKEKSLDVYNLDNNKKHKTINKEKTKKKQNMKNNKEKEKDTKDEKFDFNEEIIIGLKKVNQKENSQEKNKPVKKDQKKKSKKKRKDTEEIKNTVREEVHNQKQRLSEQELERKQQIARMKRKAVLKVVKWTSLVLIIIAGIIYALLSPIFNVKVIEVVGSQAIPAHTIISLSGIELDQNMFQYRKSEIIDKVKENAYIDTVKVKRKIPDTIEITITERTASFYIEINNMCALIGKQGYILEITSQKPKLPILAGIQTPEEELQVGKRISLQDLEKLGDALQIMESATSNQISDLITKVDISDSEDYILTLEEKKKIVHLGNTSHLSTKMLWIIKFNEIEGDTRRRNYAKHEFE